MTMKKVVAKKEPKAPKTMAGLPVAETPVAEPVHEGLIAMEVYVENIMKVRLFHVKPRPGMNIIHGDNGNGKTSALNALIWGIDGLGTTTTEPIRKGERVGIISINLGNEFIVKRHFTRVDPEKSKKGHTYFHKLGIERYNKGPHEGQLDNPQKLLNDFKSKISFDPLGFLRKNDKEQLEELRGLVTFDLDIDALDAQQDADYEERKLKGRDKDAAKNRLDGLAVPPADLPETAINVAEITKRLEGAANHNSMVAAQERRKRQLGELMDVYTAQAAEARQLAQTMLSKAQELDGQVAGISIVSAPENSKSLLNLTLVEFNALEVGELVDTAAVSAELTAATATNNAIADAARWRVAAKEHADALTAWETLDASIKERAVERAAAIARAKMPIEGLGIGDGEVLYQGLPFSQASNAEQIRVSMALGMASNPRLRIMIIKDGSLLDEKSVALVDKLAEEKGFQVFMERVMGIGNAGVLMEDGEASGEDVVTK